MTLSAEPTKLAESLVDNISNVIVGKREAIELSLVSLFSRGHILIEDVPGVGKTMLARSIAVTTGCEFRRLQFTPDLLPSDVTVASIFNHTAESYEFRAGPVTAQLVLADEVNRATPKTQSSLLEAMGERQVTVDGETHVLPEPFMVMVTQTPIEYEGTCPLPEAQLDRFLFKLVVQFPNLEELHTIMDRTTQREQPEVGEVIHQDRLVEMKLFARDVPVAKHVQDYGAVCGDCHHDRDGRPITSHNPDTIYACGKCHQKEGLVWGPIAENNTPAINLIAHRANAIHMRCIGCHQSYNNLNRVVRVAESCKTCHAKRPQDWVIK